MGRRPPGADTRTAPRRGISPRPIIGEHHHHISSAFPSGTRDSDAGGIRSRQGRAPQSWERAMPMRPNPISDAVQFLTGSALLYVFLLLAIGSLVIAGINLLRDPAQRNLRDLSTFVLRFFIGCMWWQQSLWKLPPTNTAHPTAPVGRRYGGA